MRVLIVSDTLAGGMGALVRAHASFLAAHDWDVLVTAPDDGTHPATPARFAALPTVSSLRRVHDVRAARAALRVVWGEVGSSGTVVHAHGMRSFALCRLAALPKPFVSVHGAHPAHDDPRGYGQLRRAGFSLLPLLARGATSGEPTNARGWTYHPFASPLLSTLDRLPFPEAGSTPVIAWLGLMDDRKQPGMFVHAIARVAAEGHTVQGVMGGAGPRLSEVARLGAQLDAPVEFLGQSDPVAILERAWALALFSRSEGTPLAVMEAMWAGRSVIASPLPGNRHMVGDTGVLTASLNDAVDAIRSLVTDHSEAMRRGELAAARVRTLVGRDTPWAELERSYHS